MKELVFSIENIFKTDEQAGCLSQYDCTGYYIPTYQRGYKWGSDPDGAVSALMLDLWGAFERQAQQEYYLQYITVKRQTVEVNNANTVCLEVIDGQQRLTTLSILLAALAALDGTASASAGKLHYAIRDDFFWRYIDDEDKFRAFTATPWAELAAHAATNKQDIYYLHAAARHIFDFLTGKKEKQPAELANFANYLAQRVKLIVNSVEAYVPSETVFRNLNSHKEPLTETELVKAVVITRMGRAGGIAEHKGFREVMEARLHLGRLWDELTRWANTPEINTFFFNNYHFSKPNDQKKYPDGMRQLLRLVAAHLPGSQYKLTDNDTASTNDRTLFNFYHQHPNVRQLHQGLKDVQAALADWYTDTDCYHLLGFCRFAKNSSRNSLAFLRDCLRQPDKPALKQLLTKTRAGLLPEKPEEFKNLRYDEANDSIHAVLLAASVFGEGKPRFNFHAFKRESWTLEHIFPQTPEGNGQPHLTDTQRAEVLDLLGTNVSDEVRRVLEKAERTDDEKRIYHEALRKVGHLHALGNMCLLTGKDNPSNGCMLLAGKRDNMLRLVQRGSFVPRHTFDVFGKMLPGLATGATVSWTLADIEAHGQYLEQHILSLLIS